MPLSLFKKRSETKKESAANAFNLAKEKIQKRLNLIESTKGKNKKYRIVESKIIHIVGIQDYEDHRGKEHIRYSSEMNMLLF